MDLSLQDSGPFFARAVLPNLPDEPLLATGLNIQICLPQNLSTSGTDTEIQSMHGHNGVAGLGFKMCLYRVLP